MGEAKRRSQRDNVISVLIPERGRPFALDRCIRSLIDTAGDDGYEILVAIDNDDPEWVNHEPPPYKQAKYFHWPRPATLGEKLNRLAAEATGGLLWFIANDYVMETACWAARFREGAAKLPKGIGIAYPRDEAFHPGHAAFPLMTRALFEIMGFFAAPWFGIGWFGCDTWHDELGILTGIKVEIDADVTAPEGRGRTHGMADLEFWCRFFEETRPLRARDAVQLMAMVHGQDTPEFQAEMEKLAERQKLCAARTAHLHTPAFQKRWSANGIGDLHPQYGEVKATAEKLLEDIREQTPHRPRIAICVPSGRSWEAPTAMNVAAMAAYSTLRGIEVCMLSVQTSMITHARNATVELALKERCDALLWVDSDMKAPADTLIRLMQHNKDIVGATYNKRVPPYETLGKLAGPKPDQMHDGLHEALLMPGGLLLVKAHVYKKLSYPYYAEAYEWGGDDGLDCFKAMMREYFGTVPSEDVLSSLDDTAFGGWIRDNYQLGEFGESTKTWSEDVFFSRKVRRAGFQMWCDIGLTGETVHLGVLEVTCTLPTDTVRLKEAAD